MDELIQFLCDKTHLGRFTAAELREAIGQLDAGGWEIVRKSDGVILPDEAESVVTVTRAEFAPAEPPVEINAAEPFQNFQYTVASSS